MTCSPRTIFPKTRDTVNLQEANMKIMETQKIHTKDSNRQSQNLSKDLNGETTKSTKNLSQSCKEIKAKLQLTKNSLKEATIIKRQ